MGTGLFDGCGLWYAKNGINARWVHPKKFSSKTFLGTLSVADFEASAYKRTQVRRNPNMERKGGKNTFRKRNPIFLWYLIGGDFGDVKNGINARCCCVLRMGCCTLYCPLSKTNMERKGGKNTFRTRSPNSSKRFYLFFRPFYSVFFHFLPNKYDKILYSFGKYIIGGINMYNKNIIVKL